MDVVNLSGFLPAWLTWKIHPPAWSMTLIVKGTFDLRPDAPAAVSPKPLPPCGPLHVDDDPERPLIYDGDFAPIKPKVDVLLSGSCHVPKPVDTSAVSFSLGRWSKRLAVTAREPFVRLPLAGARTVYADRPTTEGLFGPVAPTTPARKARMGSSAEYGKEWLKTRWPWWPEEFDWGYFNAAPQDQQFESLRGDEDLVLEHLHPKQAIFRSRLPGLRARAFLSGAAGFEEIPLAIDTLWIDPDHDRLVLVWRGNRPVRSEKQAEFERLFLVREPLGGPSPSKEEHRKKMEEEVRGREEGPEPAVEEPAMESEPEPPEPPEVPSETDAEMARADQEAAQAEAEAGKLEAGLADRLKEAGVEVPAAAPSTDFRKEILESLLAARDAITAAGEPVPPALEEAILHPPALVSPEKESDSPEEKEESVEEEPPEPKSPGREEIAGRKGDLSGLDLTGLDLSGLDLAEANLANAVLKGANLAKAVLRGADLSGAVLAGANLDGADLRAATMRGADLGGASLRGTDLTDAKLEESIFVAADLSDANLTLADATESDFCGADLSRAHLGKARLARAMFVESNLSGADAAGANLTAAGLTRASAKGLKADGADLTEIVASGAMLDEASFLKALANGSVWEGASLRGANFSFAQLRGAEFSTANLEKAKMISSNPREGRFVEANLKGADCTRMNLFRGSLEKADLTGANFAEANLFEAETWEAVVKDANFRGANVQRTKLAMKE